MTPDLDHPHNAKEPASGSTPATAEAVAARLLELLRELLDMWLPDGERPRVAALLARIDGEEEAAK